MKTLLEMDRELNWDEMIWIREEFQRFLAAEGNAIMMLPPGIRFAGKQSDDGNPGPLVYLCGTITTDPVHLDWREEAERKLAPHGIGVLSPIRGKDPKDWKADGTDAIRPVPYANGGFLPRDKRDVRERSDAVLIFFPASAAPDRQSIGTWSEFGWATAWDIPVVVASDIPEVTGHPCIWRQAAQVTETLDQAIEYLVFLLGE